MLDIPNTEYITINSEGIFVSGKNATHYRGVKIGYPKEIKANFQTIKTRYPNIKEMRILTSKTGGGWHATKRRPSADNGNNVWASVVFDNGYTSPWTLISRKFTYSFFINNIIGRQMYVMLNNDESYLQPIFGRYRDGNSQNMTRKSFDIPGYIIIVEKLQKSR